MVNADSQNRTETTVQFNFDATSLTNGKMLMEIYEGFTFDNFYMNDYINANVTTHTPYPHQKDFDKHKFQDVMSGNVLLAGTKRADETVKADESLRLGRANLPFDGNVLLPYEGLKALSWCKAHNGTSNGFPKPVIPCQGTGEITVTLLTHSFDDDSVLPTSQFSLRFRLIIHRESLSATSEKLFDEISYTNNPAIKKSGRVFYLNQRLSYKPPADCIGYSIEFRQTNPLTALGNESQLFFYFKQEL